VLLLLVVGIEFGHGWTVSLVVIWLAVLFVGVFGGDIVSESDVAGGTVGTHTGVPVVVVVAPLAVIATFFVTWFAYRSAKASAAPGTDDLGAKPVSKLGSAPDPKGGPVAAGHT
jgi:hypothetical protein